MKSIAAAVILALALTLSGVNSRELQQLPTLQSEGSALPSVAPAPVPSPAPSPASKPLGPVSCGLEALVNAANYNTLIELVEAASNSTAFARTLDDPTSRITLLAPTDSGIQKALAAANLKAEDVLADATVITQILNYHIFNSQLQASDLKDGYSFNTQLSTGGIAQSVAVTGNGGTATFVGAKSSAPIAGPFVTACNIVVIPIDGLLLPAS